MLLDYRLLETPAALSLSGTSFKVLIYLFKRHNGANNGEIAFGARSGCFRRQPGTFEQLEVGIGLKPSTISDALFELERAGFIRCTKDSTFDQKRRTREWRVTWLPCDGAAPTKEFEHAAGEFRRSKKQNPVRPGAQPDQLQCAQADNDPVEEGPKGRGSAPGRTVGTGDSAPRRTHLLTISRVGEGSA